ncbi:MAG: hypothetical protein J0H68_00160 [Sphingobacteriia bacterium]|nr:hypothetical protein [Sphingobacteriia bacterium]
MKDNNFENSFLSKIRETYQNMVLNRVKEAGLVLNDLYNNQDLKNNYPTDHNFIWKLKEAHNLIQYSPSIRQNELKEYINQNIEKLAQDKNYNLLEGKKWDDLPEIKNDDNRTPEQKMVDSVIDNIWNNYDFKSALGTINEFTRDKPELKDKADKIATAITENIKDPNKNLRDIYLSLKEFTRENAIDSSNFKSLETHKTNILRNNISDHLKNIDSVFENLSKGEDAAKMALNTINESYNNFASKIPYCKEDYPSIQNLLNGIHRMTQTNDLRPETLEYIKTQIGTLSTQLAGSCKVAIPDNILAQQITTKLTPQIKDKMFKDYSAKLENIINKTNEQIAAKSFSPYDASNLLNIFLQANPTDSKRNPYHHIPAIRNLENKVIALNNDLKRDVSNSSNLADTLSNFAKQNNMNIKELDRPKKITAELNEVQAGLKNININEENKNTSNNKNDKEELQAVKDKLKKVSLNNNTTQSTIPNAKTNSREPISRN